MESDKIKEVRKAKDIPDNCMLISDQYQVNEILDMIGFNHNPESIVLEDSFSSLFTDSKEGEFTEIWGIHENTVYKNSKAYRIL